MSGWELFWFAVAVLLIARGASRLVAWSWRKVRTLRDKRRLAAMKFDSPRVHVGTHGGCSVNHKPASRSMDDALVHQILIGALNRSCRKHKKDRAALVFMGQTIFTDVLHDVHTVIIPHEHEDGTFGAINLHRTDECIPDGDHLAVVFR